MGTDWKCLNEALPISSNVFMDDLDFFCQFFFVWKSILNLVLQYLQNNLKNVPGPALNSAAHTGYNNRDASSSILDQRIFLNLELLIRSLGGE